MDHDEATLDPGVAGDFSALDALAGEAAVIEGQADAAASPVPVQTTTAMDLMGAFTMVRVMASPVFADWADFKVVWSDQTLQAMADNGGAIMDRHGWSLGDLMSTWGPYIGLAAAVGPAGLATYQQIKLKREQAAREAKERAANERPQQAGN